MQRLGVCLVSVCQCCKWWHNDRKSGWKLSLASRWQWVSYRLVKCDALKQEVQDILETVVLVELFVFLLFHFHFLFQSITIKPKQLLDKLILTKHTTQTRQKATKGTTGEHWLLEWAQIRISYHYTALFSRLKVKCLSDYQPAFEIPFPLYILSCWLAAL